MLEISSHGFGILGNVPPKSPRNSTIPWSEEENENVLSAAGDISGWCRTDEFVLQKPRPMSE